MASRYDALGSIQYDNNRLDYWHDSTSSYDSFFPWAMLVIQIVPLMIVFIVDLFKPDESSEEQPDASELENMENLDFMTSDTSL